jgi:hypothetical protein
VRSYLLNLHPASVAEDISSKRLFYVTLLVDTKEDDFTRDRGENISWIDKSRCAT